MAVYSDLATLQRLAPANALLNVSADAQQKALVDKSAEADDSLQSVYTLPLVAWPASLTNHVTHAALYEILVSKGAAAAASALVYRARYNDFTAYLKRIENGLRPNGIVDSSDDPTDEPDEGAPVIVSQPLRGW